MLLLFTTLRLTDHSAPRIAFGALRLVAMLSLTTGTLAAQSGAARSTERPRAASCLATSPGIADARLDERHPIYVEQETVTPQADGRILVAGSPVFLWEQRDERHELVEQDTIVGMVIDTAATVSPVPTPLRGHALSDFRAAPLPDGWWLVTFAEITAPIAPAIRGHVLGMWAGETDGTRWRGVVISQSAAKWLYCQRWL